MSRALWNSGDYSVVCSRLMIVAEDLCETADVRGGQRALDVASGDGNTALAAARRDLHVTATDIVPELVARAQERASYEGLDISIAVGNAEALDFDDNTFDVVLSSFGVPFAVDQRAVASELLRVCQPRSRSKIGIGGRHLDDRCVKLTGLDDIARPSTDERVRSSRDERLDHHPGATATGSPNSLSQRRGKHSKVHGHDCRSRVTIARLPLDTKSRPPRAHQLPLVYK